MSFHQFDGGVVGATRDEGSKSPSR